MSKLLIIFLVTVGWLSTFCQTVNIKKEKLDPGYIQLKKQLVEKYKNVKAGRFSDDLPGIRHTLGTTQKKIALTFDACGGTKGSGYDADLIAFLVKEKIPATLFVTGSWIKKNPSIFMELCREPLFEIENHGLTHHPCTVVSESKYGIAGTGSVEASIDEIELNARLIEFYTHRKPVYYRPATAYTDEACVLLANDLKHEIAGYSVLSGDVVANTNQDVIKNNILKKVKPGAIVILHMNHPAWNTFEALQLCIPELRKRGYEFVRLHAN